MSCATFQKSLSAYLDRELPTWEKEPLVAHLEQCSSCHHELQTLLAIKTEMRSYTLPAMPRVLRDAIESATMGRFSEGKRWLHHRWFAPTLIFAAAAASWFFLKANKLHHPSSTPPQIAEVPHEQEKLVAKGTHISMSGKEF